MHGFISYAHDDYPMFLEFRNHLRAVERAFDMEFWADTRIDGGFYWNDSIRTAIERADVFVLITTASFIASDYIYEHELPAIKIKHHLGALVLPIVLKRCAWQMVASALQAIPTQNGRIKPISDWKRRGDGFDLARLQIGAAVASYFGVSPRSLDWKAP